MELVGDQGLPPQKWDYIRRVVREMFGRWKRDEANPPAKKRKKKAADADDSPPQDMEDAAEEQFTPDEDPLLDDETEMAIKEEEEVDDFEEVATEPPFPPPVPTRKTDRATSARAPPWKKPPPTSARASPGNTPRGTVAQAPRVVRGNPNCTSEEDCIGTTQDELMQHILNDEEGDVYCMSCWESFLADNPGLEGVQFHQ